MRRRLSGLWMVINPKFRNLGIVLVLVVVLVLGALAFCAGKDLLLSCNYFVALARSYLAGEFAA